MLTLSLVVFAVHVPMLVGFTVGSLRRRRGSCGRLRRSSSSANSRTTTTASGSRPIAARYDEHLVAPARELADKLSDLGAPHFFRPYNNLRFRPGPPLKEHLGVAIGYGGTGGYYFDLSLDGLLVAAGLYHPAADQLERFRAAIDDERRGARLRARPRHGPAGRPCAS